MTEKLNTLSCTAAPRRPTHPATTEKLNTLLHNYLSPVTASDQKDAKQSSHKSATYMKLSNSYPLNKNLFHSVITFLDCFVACAPRNDGETQYAIVRCFAEPPYTPRNDRKTGIATRSNTTKRETRVPPKHFQWTLSSGFESNYRTQG
jgi:hypothetical protein